MLIIVSRVVVLIWKPICPWFLPASRVELRDRSLACKALRWLLESGDRGMVSRGSAVNTEFSRSLPCNRLCD